MGKMDIYKSIIVIIIETVEHNVYVRLFTSCGEPESSKIVLKSTRNKKKTKERSMSYSIYYEIKRTEREMVEQK